jgi:hypothetical protein
MSFSFSLPDTPLVLPFVVSRPPFPVDSPVLAPVAPPPPPADPVLPLTPPITAPACPRDHCEEALINNRFGWHYHDCPPLTREVVQGFVQSRFLSVVALPWTWEFHNEDSAQPDVRPYIRIRERSRTLTIPGTARTLPHVFLVQSRIIITDSLLTIPEDWHCPVRNAPLESLM